MNFKSLTTQRNIFALCLLLVLLLTVPAAGSSNMSGIDLGVESLTLEVGESYSFQVTYEPETAIHALKWSVTDDSIINIDPVHYTVTGLQPGTARILAESFDGYDWDTCTVTVSITVSTQAGTVSSKPGENFALSANGTPVDVEQFEITVTKKAGNQIVFIINGLPEFDAEGKPVSYTVVPVNSRARISGAIYSGYEIRLPSAENPERPFFFPVWMEELPRTGFSSRFTQSTGEKPLSLNYDPTGWELQIPSLDVTAEIVQVPFLENEYPVEWLDSFAGMLEGSALPGEGACVLTGHNHLNTTESGPFALLSQLKPGTKMYVLNPKDKMTSFTVVENELLSAFDAETLEAMANQFENTLTLITCENELSEGGYANRRVITAHPD